MGDPYKVKLFPGFTSRSIHRGSVEETTTQLPTTTVQSTSQPELYTYVNGVPVPVSTPTPVSAPVIVNDVGYAHPIPATYPQAGNMVYPRSPINGVIYESPFVGRQYLSSTPYYDPPIGYQSPFGGYNWSEYNRVPPPSPNLYQQTTPMVRSRSFSYSQPPKQPQLQPQLQPPKQPQLQPPKQPQQPQPNPSLVRSQSFSHPPPQQNYQRPQQQQQQPLQPQQNYQRPQQQQQQQLQTQQNYQRPQQQQQQQPPPYQQKQQYRTQQSQSPLVKSQSFSHPSPQQQYQQPQTQQQYQQKPSTLPQQQQQYPGSTQSNQQYQTQKSQSPLFKSQSFSHPTPQQQYQQPKEKINLPRKSLSPLEPPHSIPQQQHQQQQQQQQIPTKETRPINISKEYPTSTSPTTSTTTTTTKSNESEEIRIRKRNNCLNELLSTEESYADSLEKLILYYKLPLENLVKSTSTSTSSSFSPSILHHHNNKDKEQNENTITQSDVNILFGNIEALLVISKDLLMKLKYEFSLPEREQRIGDLYIEKSKEMKLYVEYINNYEKAMETLKKIEDLHPKFFKDCQSKYKYSLDISSLLIMPVQRIPRYELLFREILKYTNPTGSSGGRNSGGLDNYHKLQEAHQSIHEINEYINNNKRLRENKDRVVTIANELKGCPNSLLKSSRRWIKEGILVTTCSNKKYNGQFMVYLFNDLIVLGRQHSTFRSKKLEYFAEINLENSEFKEIPGSPTKFRFISDPEGKKPLIFTFETESEKVKQTWISNLKLLEEERKLSIINK